MLRPAVWARCACALFLLVTACRDGGLTPLDAEPDAADSAAEDSGSVVDSGLEDTSVPDDVGPPPPVCEGRYVGGGLGEPSMAMMEPVLAAFGTAANGEQVRLRSRTLDSRNGIELVLGDVPKDRFVLLYLARSVRRAVRDEAGHWEPLGDGFVLARFGRSATSSSPVRYLGPWLAADKLGPALARDATSIRDIDVYRFTEGAIIAETFRGTRRDAQRIAADLDVLDIRQRHVPAPTLDISREAVKADEAQRFSTASGLPVYDGLTGRGACIAVVDTGLYGNHPDFWDYDWRGMVIGRRGIGETTPEGEGAHGTLVAGFIGGNGWLSDGESAGGRTGTPYGFRGIAPGVSQIVSIISGRPAPWNAAFLDYGCHASNHSHTQSDGTYNRSSLDWDRTMFFGAFRGDEAAPPRPVVFSMGNNGAYHAHSDIPVRGYYGGTAPAKNPIVVGGSNTNDDTHAAGAASGPALDGRLRPDLVAGGYVDVRPFDGTEIALEEVRLVATMGSGATDVVWTPGTTGEWSVGSAIEGADIVDGRAVFRAFGGGTWLRYEPLTPIDAASYDTVTVRLEILDAGDPTLHQPPNRLAIQWDRDGDGRYDRGNWPFVTPGAGVQTYTRVLSGWADTPHSLHVEVARYESSSVVVSHRGEYRSSGGGTSLSAPVVSGAIALLIEELQTGHGYDFETAPPLPSTFKAILVHTARDMIRLEAPARDPVNPDTGEAMIYHPGPDWSTGYGLLHVGRAVALVDGHSVDAPRFVERPITDGAMHAYEVRVAGDGGPLVATLAWDDFAGSATLDPRESVLVNDLDVVAISPSGVAHGPWILQAPPLADDPLAGIDPITTSDIVPATRCVEPTYWEGASTWPCEDHLNNLEQVVVDDPEPGTWSIRVRGIVLEDDQRYSLVVTQNCGE